MAVVLTAACTAGLAAPTHAETLLTLGAAHTAASIKEGLRAKGIHLISATAA